MLNRKEVLMQQLITLLTQLIALNEAEEKASAAQPETVEMLTIKEAAAIVPGLSEHTVRLLALQGKVPSVRTGKGRNGKILINKDALIAYLNGAA
jgi:excisionase family DNA binding protein